MAKPRENETLSVAEAWLALVDVGDTDGSWETGAVLFKSAIDRESWRALLEEKQSQSGKLVLRKLISQDTVPALPGLPVGESCVINYESVFEHKNGKEEVILVRDAKGDWSVFGYSVK